MAREIMDRDLRLKRAFCLLVCGCMGLLFAVVGTPPASVDQDLAPLYAYAIGCTIMGIAAGLVLVRFERHVRAWEIAVAAILVLLIVSMSWTEGNVHEHQHKTRTVPKTL